MDKFYQLNDNTFAVIFADNTVIGFTHNFTIALTQDITVIQANFKEQPEGQAIYETVKDRSFLESVDGIDFFVDKKTFKISGLFNGQIIDLDSPDSKDKVVGENKKMKDFLKGIKKAKESYKMGDRILLYGPTGTGKTFNFLHFLKTAKIEHTIIPVSEGMEDLDLLNFIVPSETGGVSYKPKEITELLEKAVKWEKVCIIFDELNRGSNSLMNLVLKALDPVDGKNYYITNILQDKTYVIPQDNIIWGATVNLGGKYTGTNALDEALFDRFNIVSFVGYNPEVEKAIVHAAGFDTDHTKKILDFVSKVRDFAKSGELRSPISTRGIKVWMEDFLNSSDLMLSFERTLLFRLVTVDEFGSPNDKELAIVKKQFQTILK